MRTRNLLYSIIIMSVLIFVYACSPAQSRYKEARSIDTIAAYQEFLKSYPEGEFAETAKTRIENKKFEKAKSVNTVSAYEQFIDSSNSELFKNYATQQIRKIYEEGYIKAKEINTLEAYQAYIKKYPGSIYSEDCNKRIESLTWFKTIKENTAFSYYNYLNNCSVCGQHDKEARNRFSKRIKTGVAIKLSSVKSKVEKILSRSDIVTVQRGPKGVSARTGSTRLENLMAAEDVLVSIAKDVQSISAMDLEKGNFESVEKLRLKHPAPANEINSIGFGTVIIYSGKNGKTDVIFIANGKGYYFQESGSKIK
jgi:hypothetical protein